MTTVTPNSETPAIFKHGEIVKHIKSFISSATVQVAFSMANKEIASNEMSRATSKEIINMKAEPIKEVIHQKYFGVSDHDRPCLHIFIDSLLASPGGNHELGPPNNS